MKPKHGKSDKARTVPAEKPKPATKKALAKVLKQGMKQYKNTLKALAKS